MDRIKDFVSVKKNLVGLFVVVILFNLCIPILMPKDYALDLMFAYTFQEANQSIMDMGAEWRTKYFFGIMLLDMPYIIIYTLAFYGLLLKLWGDKKIIKIPFLIGLMDLMENLSVAFILKSFPDLQVGLVRFASFFTSSKWILVAFLALLVLGGIFKSICLKYSCFSKDRELSA